MASVVISLRAASTRAVDPAAWQNPVAVLARVQYRLSFLESRIVLITNVDHRLALIVHMLRSTYTLLGSLAVLPPNQEAVRISKDNRR